MNGFDAQWLRQRAPYDAAARSPRLAADFVSALGPRTSAPLRLLDLAAGTGANFRALAPQIAHDQDWLLVDHDATLLARLPDEITHWARQGGRRCEALRDGVRVHGDAGTVWCVRTRQLDLAGALESLDAAAFDGITTTAFLDLVSDAWLARLAAWLVASGRPVLATLTVDGRRLWQPGCADDALIDDAFRRHQAGDKGFGPSLGPDAAPALAALLRARGYAVDTAPADWRIAADDAAMLLRMIDEAADVARETMPACAHRVHDWRALRRDQVARAGLTLIVGHADLFACAPRAAPAVRA